MDTRATARDASGRDVRDRRSLWGCVAPPLDRRDEAVAAPRQRLDKHGRRGAIAERGADLVDARGQAGFEIDVRLAPDFLSQLVARDDRTGALDEEDQHTHRLPGEGDLAAGATEFGGGQIEFEGTDPREGGAACGFGQGLSGICSHAWPRFYGRW